MPAPASRAQDIAARLSAVDFEPRVIRYADRLQVEADVSEPSSPARWQAVIAALARADRFGLSGSADGLTAWAVIWTKACAHAQCGETPRKETDEPQQPSDLAAGHWS
ncbi:hypothetical protein [Streptomyces netropsis]|uniref:Uncharacterized protein n=1 Tax=Streptomyces netropsis TaxID=55404 RepID=A0A7W7LIZ6_STRNE|nr:hypothetical protein [Streptomyces netropsis]MBB4890767.1 hypothetical protein [Streptomyces netropsis]GGR51862.1 hypothetical protein GCM10010219_66210 [Streptomyces netropsis]